ncbi:MAG: hypothetical protein NZ898_00260 [Myxococcota bacterium]|nr:hypothetical protein [Myxococcota bacterium]MDW8361977.1 hypothetical protein [Myxococcales bacterium]
MHPETQSALRAVGCWLLEVGDASRAMRVLAGLVALDASDTEAARALAQAALRCGQWERAARVAAHCAQLARAAGRLDAEAHVLVARALLGAGRRAEALGWLRAALDPGAGVLDGDAARHVRMARSLLALVSR